MTEQPDAAPVPVPGQTAAELWEEHSGSWQQQEPEYSIFPDYEAEERAEKRQAIAAQAAEDALVAEVVDILQEARKRLQRKHRGLQTPWTLTGLLRYVERIDPDLANYRKYDKPPADKLRWAMWKALSLCHQPGGPPEEGVAAGFRRVSAHLHGTKGCSEEMIGIYLRIAREDAWEKAARSRGRHG